MAAGKTFEKILAKYPDNARANFGLAVASLLNHDADRAQELFEKLVGRCRLRPAAGGRSKRPAEARLRPIRGSFPGRMCTSDACTISRKSATRLLLNIVPRWRLRARRKPLAWRRSGELTRRTIRAARAVQVVQVARARRQSNKLQPGLSAGRGFVAILKRKATKNDAPFNPQWSGSSCGAPRRVPSAPNSFAQYQQGTPPATPEHPVGAASRHSNKRRRTGNRQPQPQRQKRIRKKRLPTKPSTIRNRKTRTSAFNWASSTSRNIPAASMMPRCIQD